MYIKKNSNGGDGGADVDDPDHQKTAASAAPAGGKGSKAASSNLMETLSEDGNLNMSNVTNAVVGKVGNLFGKGIGGLSSKLGGGGWF